jgi:hypothetical protein
MSETATPTAQSPAGVFNSVLNAAVGSAAAKLEQRVVAWTDKLNGVGSRGGSSELAQLADEGLDDVAEGGGARLTAGAAGVKAGMHGKNPFWAAIKGAWRGGTPAAQAAIVAAAASAILLLLVSPVLLLVYLFSLLIIAAVHRARSATT